MSAVTGQQFISLLTGMLSRANLDDSEMAYYSFVPVAGQTEFVYNSLFPSGQAFLQTIQGIQIINGGSGYGLSEVPNVSFKSLDAGTGVVGSVVMQTVNDAAVSLNQGLIRVYPFNTSGNNLIINGTFSSGVTGWYSSSLTQLTSSSTNYTFHSGNLEIIGGATLSQTKIVPNSGHLILTGPLDYIFSLDVLSGSPSGASSIAMQVQTISGVNMPVFTKGIAIGTGTGTQYCGGYIPAGTSFIPMFNLVTLSSGLHPASHALLGNFKCTTGTSILRDVIKNSVTEQFVLTPNSSGYYLVFEDGISNAGIGDISTNVSDGSKNQATASINDDFSSYTISLWVNFSTQSRLNNFSVDLAEWPNFKLQIRNGYYGLLCTLNNTFTATNMQPTNGWDNIQVTVSPSVSTAPLPPIGS